MDHSAALKVVEDHFSEDPEVKEVAMYALSVIHVNDEVMRAMQLGNTTTANIPPESLVLMKAYDNGMIKNQFFAEHYAIIKSQLALDDIKLHTTANYLKYYKDRGDKNALKTVRANLMSRFDVLTTIALFYKGDDFSKQFDSKFRLAIQLPEEYEKFFADEGI